MKLFEWLKWWVAPKEMEELERWRVQWHEHRRWFAEFPVAAVTLDRLKAKADGEPVTNIQVVRDSCRSEDLLLEKSKPVAYRAWFDADNGARWLFTLWPEEERLDVVWEPLFTAPKASIASQNMTASSPVLSRHTLLERRHEN